MQKAWVIVTTFSALLFADACSDSPSPRTDNNDIPQGIAAINAKLLPGINLGNALEAPNEGDWGVTIQDNYFAIMKSAGFRSVRLPIRWSAHAATVSPYTIDPLFLTRVRHVVNTALQQELSVVINIHHYDELFTQPAEHKTRFLALWRQLAEQFQDFPADLLFEVLNEPHDQLTATLWNEYLQEALTVIRESNPRRALIIGVAEWGGIGALNQLSLPDSDTSLVVTVHYYEPFPFTHQGAEWVAGSDRWLGTTWSATSAQKKAIDDHFQQIKGWAVAHHRPIYIGEFGAYQKADLNSRQLWTAYIVNKCRDLGFSYAYWEFCSGFGAYDAGAGTWRQPLLEALIQNP